MKGIKSSDNTKMLVSHIPEEGLRLTKYSGKDVTERLGEDVVKQVVASILCGKNVRSLTEELTQRRITLSNGAMLISFLRWVKNIDNFDENWKDLVKKELKSRLTPEEKAFVLWIVGLTSKSIQNVLRGDSENLNPYLDNLQKTINSTSKRSQELYGELKASFSIEGVSVNWGTLIHLFLAIGTQALAIRGSEKSMYGKLFEKLVLGSVLSILGFKYVDSVSKESNMVFWLSQRENKRESDATILIKAGVGVRFDIGFIGPGNTEISLDKVSRFETHMTTGTTTHTMTTIILVDRIGEGSRIPTMAKAINGHIIQMSMTYWVYELAQILKSKTGYEHEILKGKAENSIEYINEKIKTVKLTPFTEKIIDGE